MSIISYRSIRIADIREIKKAWSGISSDTIEMTIQSTYDKSDIKSHICEVSMLEALFHYNPANRIKDLFSILIILLLNSILALVYPFLLSSLFFAFSPGFSFSMEYMIAYLYSFVVCMIVWLLIKAPKSIEKSIDYQLKKDCFRKRGHDISKFKEKEFDTMYRVVRESEWNGFMETLK